MFKSPAHVYFFICFLLIASVYHGKIKKPFIETAPALKILIFTVCWLAVLAVFFNYKLEI